MELPSACTWLLTAEVKKQLEATSATFSNGFVCKWMLDKAGKHTREKTRWISNSPFILRRLNELSRDEQVVWRRSKERPGGAGCLNAQPPVEMFAEIMSGLREEIDDCKELDELETELGGPVPEEPVIPEEYKQLLESGGGFWDDVNGGMLPADWVIQA